MDKASWPEKTKEQNNHGKNSFKTKAKKESTPIKNVEGTKSSVAFRTLPLLLGRPPRTMKWRVFKSRVSW